MRPVSKREASLHEDFFLFAFIG